MLARFLGYQLLKFVMALLIGLALFGVASTARIAAVLLGFTFVRLISLVKEAVIKPRSQNDWPLEETEQTQHGPHSEPDSLATGKEIPSVRSFSPKITSAGVQPEPTAYPPPRGKLDLAADVLGLFGFVLLFPGVIALYTHDFYSLRMAHEWPGTVVAMLGMALYLWPQCWSQSSSVLFRRRLWWALPFVVLLGFFTEGIATRHPYLNPLHPDHARLAADRMLALENNVLAAHHVDWVMRYARKLDNQGDKKQAAYYYREALRLDSNDMTARARLADLEEETGASYGPDKISSAPYWMPDQALKAAPRVKLDQRLQNVEGCTVVLVAMGKVPDHLLDSVAFAIERELGIPVLVRSKPLLEPEHTRVRGLVTGKQWDVVSLHQSFFKACEPFPVAPLHYILITSADIYMGESNFVFSAAYEGGAIVSFARYGAPEPGSLCSHRTAKQSLCALLKSFKIPMSPERHCVTSYTRTLKEFDQKGNRPCGPVLAQFQEALSVINEEWKRSKAR